MLGAAVLLAGADAETRASARPRAPAPTAQLGAAAWPRGTAAGARPTRRVSSSPRPTRWHPCRRRQHRPATGEATATDPLAAQPATDPEPPPTGP